MEFPKCGQSEVYQNAAKNGLRRLTYGLTLIVTIAVIYIGPIFRSDCYENKIFGILGIRVAFKLNHENAAYDFE